MVLQQDGQTNSYSVAGPSFQTSFSRFYGRQPGGDLIPQQLRANEALPAQGQVLEQGQPLEQQQYFQKVSNVCKEK